MCRVYGEVTKDIMAQLTEGIEIDGVLMRFLRVSRRRGEGRNTWFSVTLNEGRYREVRRLWEAVGCRVSRLNRIGYGKIQIPRGLKLGAWTELNPGQIDRLAKNSPSQGLVTPKITKSRTPGKRNR